MYQVSIEAHVGGHVVIQIDWRRGIRNALSVDISLSFDCLFQWWNAERDSFFSELLFFTT